MKMEKQLKPQLACDGDLDKIKFPVWGFRKLDGVRLMNITGKATGRSLKAHGNLYVTEKYSNKHTVGFDGEATFGDIRGQSLCRDTTSVMSRIQGNPEIEWHLFDWIHTDMLDMTYSGRYLELLAHQQANPEWFENNNIFIIPYRVLNNIQEVEAYYEESLEMGFEGCILRDPSAKHKSGRATVKENSYLRLKPQSDKEAKVVRLVEAMENQNEAKTNELGRTERSSHKENKVGKGMVGMLVCIDVVSGMEIDVGAGKMTHEERKYYWEHPEEIVGSFIKYKSMDVGIKTKPRFARYICKRSVEDMSE